MPRKVGGDMVLISVHLPRRVLVELDELVKAGLYPSRGEVVRTAIRDLLEKEHAALVNAEARRMRQ